MKKQNKRDWNSAWDDQSIPCLATDDVCGQPGAVWVGWGPSLCCVLTEGCSSAGHPAAGCGEPFSEPSSSRGCSASLPLYSALHDPQGPSGNQKYPNTTCLWGFYARVSCQEGQHSFTEPGRALQPDPSPAITAAGRGLGWVGGWDLHTSGSGRVTFIGRSKKRGEISFIINCVIELSSGQGAPGQFCLL